VEPDDLPLYHVDGVDALDRARVDQEVGQVRLGALAQAVAVRGVRAAEGVGVGEAQMEQAAAAVGPDGKPRGARGHQPVGGLGEEAPGRLGVAEAAHHPAQAPVEARVAQREADVADGGVERAGEAALHEDQVQAAHLPLEGDGHLLVAEARDAQRAELAPADVGVGEPRRRR
jgi:hypothetical protein